MIKSITCEQVAAYFSQKTEAHQRIIILDTRALSAFTGGHISSAIHICIPNTLLKRKNFTFANIEATVSCHESRQRLQLRESADVILCDADGTSCRKSDSPLMSLVTKFQEESLANSVSFIEGGYDKFSQLFPELCTKKKEKSSHGQSSTSPFCLSLPCRKSFSAHEHDGTRKNILKEVNTTLSDEKGEPARILDFLYVGDQQMAAHQATLEKYGISWILNTAMECPNFFESNPSFNYMRLDLADSATQTLSMSTLERAFDFIDDARKNHKKVLVHCQAGQSRSATIVISYIIRTFRWTLKDAYQYTQSKRRSISPNLGFMAQLSQFEKNILGVSSPMQQVFSECERVLTTPQFLDCAA